jgi:hypothetical protein
MRFNDTRLQQLATSGSATDIARAEAANLLLEERVSDDRLASYETTVTASAPSLWDSWREAHEHYIVHEVRGGNGKDPATFQRGEPALASPEPNQFVLRLEELNAVLIKEGLLQRDPIADAAKDVAEQINRWISERKQAQANAPRPSRVSSLAQLGRLTGRQQIPLTGGIARLETLTEALNAQRRDRRPSFIAFDAEFRDVDSDPSWLDHFCQRCGLAHHFAGFPKVLALFRYKVETVLAAHPDKAPFASPTVLDQPFSPIFFPAPLHTQMGHAICLEPSLDCSHLAAELVHARVDYTPDHWVRVGTLNGALFDNSKIASLRETHLRCLRAHSQQPSYGDSLP